MEITAVSKSDVFCVDNITASLGNLAEIFKIPYATVYRRIRIKGMSVTDALKTPLDEAKRASAKAREVRTFKTSKQFDFVTVPVVVPKKKALKAIRVGAASVYYDWVTEE